MTSIMQQNCQIIEPLTEKTWGQGWVVLVVIQNGGTFLPGKIANKHVLSKMNLSLMEVSMFQIVFILGIILNE